MENSAQNRMGYELHQDADRTLVWNGNELEKVVTSANANVPVDVYGRILAQGALPDGTYTDTVQITVGLASGS